MERFSRWPAGTTSALCLTFDIDAETMWTSLDDANEKRLNVISQAAYEIEVGIPLVLDLLRANGILTTFFIPGTVALNHADMVRQVIQDGHEVACHGWLHESVDGMTQDEEGDLIRRSTAAVAEVAGVAPMGYRAALAEVNGQTWDILREHGYFYSSNLASSLWPYLHEGDGPRVVEIPIHSMLDDGPYFLYSRRPPNYRQFYPPSVVSEIWTEEFRAIHNLGGVTTLVLHPQLIGRPSRLKILQDLIEVANRESGVWFARMCDLANHVLSVKEGEAS